jgi:hypothetical protein
MKNIKCNKCQYVGPESEFPKGNDFFQNKYVAGCPKCDNRQSPGDASMRGFGGQRPFEYVDALKPIKVTDKPSAIAEVYAAFDFMFEEDDAHSPCNAGVCE